MGDRAVTLRVAPYCALPVPSPCAVPSLSIVKFEADLKTLGGDVNYGRGSMMHLILTLCRRLEEAFGRIVDGKKDGKPFLGEQFKGGVKMGVCLVKVMEHTEV